VSFFTGSLTPFQLDWVDPRPLFPSPPTDRAIRKPVLADDLQSGPLPRVAWFQGSNAIKQAPASAATARALAGIRFKVAVEVRLSETASMCDLVLPAASFLEFEDVRGSFGTPWVGHMAPVAPPAGDSRPEPDIYACLARRLGLEHHYLEGGGPEGWLRRALLPLAGRGVTLEVLRERGGIVATGDNAYPELPFSEGRFATPDGRFRFLGHEDFQRYLRLRDEWQSEGCYPLQLITPKAPGRINSHPDTDARDGPCPPVARVHPQHVPAKAVEGETALLLTRLGQIRVRLLRDPAMKPGVVVVEQGGRVPDAIGINALIPATLSEDGEGACYYEARCRLEASPD
ncbi:MAG: molybdopterin-dependent oxidoreductase, partial [Bacillota bacterium]